MRPQDLVLTPRGLRHRGRILPCTIGRGGLRRDKCEGDGATPVGRHRIVGLMYRPDRIKAPNAWAMPIRPGDLWSDDGADLAYNSLVRAPYEHSHEAMRRADPMYDLLLLTDWNWPNAQAGRGSAIFLHVWRGPGQPTAGCIAFTQKNLLWIAKGLQPGARLIVPDLAGVRI